jgi:hypothetical protein
MLGIVTWQLMMKVPLASYGSLDTFDGNELAVQMEALICTSG